MTHAVPTKPERLMRRLPRNSRHGLFARPTCSLSVNSDRPARREGGGGFTEPGAHASPMPAGMIHMMPARRPDLVRAATHSATSAEQTTAGDASAEPTAFRNGHGGCWRAPRTHDMEV